MTGPVRIDAHMHMYAYRQHALLDKQDYQIWVIQDVGSQRVMMGSDFPWYDMDHNVERVMELPLLSREEKEAILGANAVRILLL